MAASVTQLENQTNRYKDFDAAVEASQPVKLRVKGRDYELPPDIEAGPVLRLIKEGALDDPAKSVDLLESIVGKENLDQMMQDGLGLNQFVEITQWLAEEYNIVGTEAVDPKRG